MIEICHQQFTFLAQMAPNALQFLMFGLSTPFKIDELGSPPSNPFYLTKQRPHFYGSSSLILNILKHS